MPSNKLNLRDRLDDFTLDLSMSDLNEVPVRDIAVIKKATTLDLSNNRLTTLGKSFCTLTHLVKLDLSKNQLRQLPENFGDLVQLKHLDLYSNQLNHLPLSLSKLKSLRWLDLKSNPLVPAIADVAGPCLDPKQCQQCARSVVTFLQGMQAKVDQERQRLLQVKQKQQEQADLVAQAQKKEQQQQKKKKKAAKSGNNPQAKVENGLKSAPISISGNQGGITSKKSNAQTAKNKNKNIKSNAGSGLCWRLLKSSLVLTTLVSMGLVTLFMVDRKMFSLMMEGFGQRWKAAVDSLPPQMAQPLEVFANGTVNAVQMGYSWLSTNAQVKSFLSTTKSLLDVAYVRLMEAYQTVNHQLPVYVDTLKKKFM